MYRASIYPMKEIETIVEYQGIADIHTDVIESDSKIEQEFKFQGTVSGISFPCKINDAQAMGNELQVILLNSISGNVLAETKINTQNSYNNGWINVHFENTVDCEKDNLYILKIIPTENYIKDSEFRLFYGLKKNIKTEYFPLQIDNEEYSGSLAFNFIRKGFLYIDLLYVLVVVAFLFCMVIVYGLIFVKKANVETIVCGSVILLGIFYLFVMPPYTITDEEAHYATTYEYSNRLLGLESIDFKADYIKPIDGNDIYIINGDAHHHAHYKIKCRETDKEAFESMRRYIGVKEYQSMMSGMVKVGPFSSDINTFFEEHVLKISPIVYAPGIIGITVGRVVGFSGMQTMQLGRLFNLFLFAFIVYWAIKKIPLGKIVIATLTLLPITVSLAASFSYDGLLIALAFLYIGWILDIIYNEKRLRVRDIAILSCCALMFGVNKIVYCLLLLLILLVPYKKNRYPKASFVGMSACLGGSSLMGILVTQMGNLQAYSTDLSGLGRYSFGYILENPLWFILSCFRSVLLYASDYIGGMIGLYMGQRGTYEITLQWAIVIAFLAVIIFGILNSSYRGEIYNKKVKILGVLIFVGIFGLLFVIACTWNPLGRQYFSGIQGRYLLPVLPLVLFCTVRKGNNLKITRGIDEKLIGIEVFLHFFVFISILSCVITRIL